MEIKGSPRQFVRTRCFSAGGPRDFAVSPDGDRALFLRSTSGAVPRVQLWMYERGDERILAAPTADGREKTLAAERISPEPAPAGSAGVVSYATDRHVRAVAYDLDGSLGTVRTDGGPPRRIQAVGPVGARAATATAAPGQGRRRPAPSALRPEPSGFRPPSAPAAVSAPPVR